MAATQLLLLAAVIAALADYMPSILSQNSDIGPNRESFVYSNNEPNKSKRVERGVDENTKDVDKDTILGIYSYVNNSNDKNMNILYTFDNATGYYPRFRIEGDTREAISLSKPNKNDPENLNMITNFIPTLAMNHYNDSPIREVYRYGSDNLEERNALVMYTVNPDTPKEEPVTVGLKAELDLATKSRKSVVFTINKKGYHLLLKAKGVPFSRLALQSIIGDTAVGPINEYVLSNCLNWVGSNVPLI